MRIGNHKIGPDHPPLIIAEIGLACEGSVDTALEHIRRAKDAGAGAVKQQCHVPLDAEMTEEHPWRETIARCMLAPSELRRCREYARELGLAWLCTAYSVEGAHIVEDMDPDAHKVGSGEVTFTPLLDYIAITGRPVLLSNGMADEGATGEPENMVLDRFSQDVMILDCTSQYPTPLDAVRIWDTVGYRGWSDHTGRVESSLAAIAHGAPVVEVHVPRQGPDAEASISWRDLRQLCSLAPGIWQAESPPTREPDESATRRMCQRDEDGRRSA